eukprot:TRINITY_DN4048_c0_g1_i1.p1 TRINITY_DN4048_c0_g1~~TRINITY_DN4048_c0_g1_i1.p1  ORF type:complete len:261 (+),score=53.27 TRINITY_DN4048_c0_g1_i1:46-828(+)
MASLPDDDHSDVCSNASSPSTCSSSHSYSHNPYGQYSSKEYHFSPAGSRSVSPSPSVGDLGSLGDLGGLATVVNPNIDYSNMEYASYGERLQEVNLVWMVLVQFKFGRTGWFEHTEEIEEGKHVIVQADRGHDMGMVARCEVKNEKHEELTTPFKIQRMATKQEICKWQDVLTEREAKAKDTMQQMTNKKKLHITVVHAEYQFDGKKLTFYFTSKEAHPQFRVILDQAFSTWKCRIWFARYSRLALDAECRERLEALSLT